jgi:hypothetical protein
MCVTVWFEISGISIDELRHAGYCRVGDFSTVYLKMNLAKSVTVWFEISGISVDELRHAGYCVVGNLRYI